MCRVESSQVEFEPYRTLIGSKGSTKDNPRSKLENGQYGHAPIRSDTSIRVYTMADTDTSTPCIGVPATCNIIPGRLLRECSLLNEWHMQTISNKQTWALSQLYYWLIRSNLVIDSWLLLSLPADEGSAAWWWPRPVLRCLCVTGRLVSGYSLLPPPSPPILSSIMDHKTAHTCAHMAGGWQVAWTPFDHRV